MPFVSLPVSSLTEVSPEGSGVFDILMRANKAHLDDEYAKNRIRGPEYATVYLGSLEAVMRASLEFLLQKEKSAAEIALIEAQTELVTQQTLNAVTEGLVLQAQKCKLDAEFDLIQAQRLKSASEQALLDQKVVTERAQTTAMGVDDNSVIGRQKALYLAQSSGFARDAEQKVAKVMVDSWNVRRSTDEATVADGTNMLNDAAVGRAVSKLLSGVGA